MAGNYKFNISVKDLDNINTTQVYTASTVNLTPCDEKTPGKQLQTTDFGAFLHVVKSSLGTGVLASANGFKNAGIIVGVIGTIIIGILCTHCTYILVKCSDEMSKVLGKPNIGYEETLEAALKRSKNNTLRKMAGFANTSAGFFILITYCGCTTVYILMVSESLKQLMESHVDFTWDIRIYILIVAVPVMVTGIIRNLKYLVPFSGFANLCFTIGLGVTFFFVTQNLPPVSSRPPFSSIQQLPLFITTVLFGMEGFGTMIPIKNSMKNPGHFLGWFGVLNCGMAVIVALFVSIGFFGYLKYGPDTQSVITLNLPNDVYSETVKGLTALAILFTYGLQLTAAIDIVWKFVESRFRTEDKTRAYYLTRASLILGTVLIALALPNLGPIISLVGAVGISTCGFFYPALMETAILTNRGFGKFNWLLWKNIALMFIAVVACVSGSTLSLSQIIAQYR